MYNFYSIPINGIYNAISMSCLVSFLSYYYLLTYMTVCDIIVFQSGYVS